MHFPYIPSPGHKLLIYVLKFQWHNIDLSSIFFLCETRSNHLWQVYGPYGGDSINARAEWRQTSFTNRYAYASSRPALETKIEAHEFDLRGV